MQSVVNNGPSLAIADWKRAGILLLGGVILHLFYIFLLTKALPMDQWNWRGGDTGSYLRPAESFLQEGTFALKGAPDYRRTVGYPLFIAGCIKLADTVGTDLRMTVYVLQALLFSFAYPSIFLIGRLLFELPRRQALWSVFFIAATGNYVSYVPILLTDALFSSLLVSAVACGLLALFAQNRRRLWWAMAHIALVMYAAHVRPMLAFFPIAVLCVHGALLKNDGWKVGRHERKTLALVIFIITVVGVQTPALRNWFHHGVFTPSEIGSINLYNYLAYDVLKFRGDRERYQNIERKLEYMEGPEHLQERIDLRKRSALEIFRESPGITAGHLIYYTVLNSIETHWQNLFYLGKKTWYRDYEDGSVVWSPVPFLVALGFIVLYGNIYLISLHAIISRPKNLLLIVSVLLFLIPYVFCGTSYQGARFRLWLEPFLVLFVFKVLPHYIRGYQEGGNIVDKG